MYRTRIRRYKFYCNKSSLVEFNHRHYLSCIPIQVRKQHNQRKKTASPKCYFRLFAEMMMMFMFLFHNVTSLCDCNRKTQMISGKNN